MNNDKLICALEAVLFAAGESVSSDRLQAVLNINGEKLCELIDDLTDIYDRNKRGMKIIRLGDKYQMVSRPDYGDYVRLALESGRAPMLSSSAMEVLSIVAYKQPVTRAYIEQIRGVDSSHTLSSLVDKGLAEICGRLDMPGRPALYRTSEKFLRSFGLSGLDQLPYIEGFNIESAEQSDDTGDENPGEEQG